MARSSLRPGAARTTLPAYALALLAVVAPQLLGGTTDGTLLTILGLASVACVITVIALRSAPDSLGFAPFGSLAFAGLAVWTLVQALPIPCSWVDWAQPERAYVNKQLVLLHALDSARCSLSYAPGGTRIRLALAAVIGALVLASNGLARTGHRDLLARGVALSSVVMAIVAIAHFVMNASDVFGLYTPRHASPGLLIAPLMNANNLAGLLALGLPLCLSFGLRAKRLDARLIWSSLSFVVLATGLMTLSRGGAAALIGGAAAYFLIHSQTRRRTNHGRRTIALVALALGTGATLAIYFSVDLLAREFDSPDATASKLSQLGALLRLSMQHPLAGIGRGATTDLSPMVIPGNVHAVYAESMPVQWLVEWGIPATVAALALLGLSFAAVRPRSSSGWALLVGVAALYAQNLVDFGLELAGVAVPAAIALGTLFSHEKPSGYLSWLPRPKTRISLTVATLLAVSGLLASLPFLTTRSRTQLRGQLETHLGDASEEFAAALARGFDAYPLDPTFMVLAAAHAARLDSPLAGHWLNLAMQAAPSWAAPHAQAAHWLERRNRHEQASLELALTFERDPTQAWGFSCAFLGRHPFARFAWSALPGSPKAPQRQRVAEHLAGCLMEHAPREESEDYLEKALAQYPGSTELHRRFVGLALDANDLPLARRRVERMMRDAPTEGESTAVLMRLLCREGTPLESLKARDRAPPNARSSHPVLLEAMAAAALAKAPAALDAAVEELLARHASTSKRRSQAHWYASVYYEGANELAKALMHAQNAYDLEHEASVLERVHALAIRTGISRVALRSAAELCHLRHRGGTYCAGAPAAPESP